MITYIGYFFILLGVTDFILANFAEFDLYAMLGINLEGIAYQYSPYGAGILGAILVTLGNRNSGDQVEEEDDKN